MSEPTPNKREVEELIHEDTECTLCVTYESYGRKYAEETYPVEFSVNKWRHIRRSPELYSRLEKDCSDRQARLTDAEAASVIGLTCDRSQCRSVIEKLQWSRSLQNYFRNTAADLTVIEYSVPEHSLSSVYKRVSESPSVCSGVATAFKSNDRIVVITGKQHKEEVAVQTERILSERTESFGYISLDDSGYNNEVLLMTSITCNELERTFFDGNSKARDYISSKLEQVCGGTFCIEDGQYKLLLFGESNDDLDTARAIYESSIIQKIWSLKDSKGKKGEMIRECQQHFQKTMKGSAWCMPGEDSDIASIARKEVTKDVDAYMKMNMKQKVEKGRSHVQLLFSFQGKKFNLLKNRPKARDYVAQCVSKSSVKFEVAEQLLEFRLVTTEDHKDEAIQFLTLVRTIDIELEDVNKQRLQAIVEELIKRNPMTKHQMVIEIDISTMVLSITATGDVFNTVLQSCEQLLQEHALTDTYSAHKEVLRRALKREEQVKGIPKCNNDKSSFNKAESKRGIQEMKSCLNNTAKEIQGRNSSSRTSLPSMKCRMGEGGQVCVSKEIQKILSVSENARRLVVEELAKAGLGIHISSSGEVNCTIASEVDCERAERHLNDCFIRKIIDFELFPIRAYLKPSDAQEGLRIRLERLLERMHIHADDTRNTVDLVFTRDIARKVDTELQRFLEEYVQWEKSFTLSSDEMKRFWLSASEEEFEHPFVREKVNITLTGTKLVITGAKVGVEACVEKMQRKQLLPDSALSREVDGKVFAKKYQRRLSTHMTSFLDNNSNAKTFVEDVFHHVGLEADVTPGSSDINISKKTQPAVPGGTTLQKKKKRSFSLMNENITAESLKKAVDEEEPDLADKVLVHEDEVSGKLVVVGEKDAVDAYLRRLRSSRS